MGVRKAVKHVLESKYEKVYADRLAALRVTYAQWLREQEAAGGYGEEKVSGTAQDSADTRQSEYILFLQQRGQLAAQARAWIAGYFTRHPEVDIVYGDEDLLGVGAERREPWFRPVWSPDLYESCFCVGSVVAVRREALTRVSTDWSAWQAWMANAPEPLAAGMKACLQDGADILHYEKLCEVRGLLDALLEAAGGYAKGEARIGHIEAMLFHAQSKDVWEEYLASRASEEHRNRMATGRTALTTASAETSREAVHPTISVIIPSKDQPELLASCVAAVRRVAQGGSQQTTSPTASETQDENETQDESETQDGNETQDERRAQDEKGAWKGKPRVEIVVVDNGSSAENRARIEAIPGIDTYLYEAEDFNFSRMCNRGAAAAHGELLLFLNDDCELADETTFEVLAERALRPYVGAVGCKLYYPTSEGTPDDAPRGVKADDVSKDFLRASTKQNAACENVSNQKIIQHDGIVNLGVGPVHKLQFHSDDTDYYAGWNRGMRNCIAVTGACLMVEASKYREVGGFREDLAVAYNDVELCFSLLEKGYQNVVCNDITAIHHESVSRGSDESPAKQARLARERAHLYDLHPTLRGRDPYYPMGLNREGLDARIVPAYLVDRNVPEAPAWEISTLRSDELRRDDCLMARVETTGPERLQGYSVVLGDNNACYEKLLLLVPVQAEALTATTAAPAAIPAAPAATTEAPAATAAAAAATPAAPAATTAVPAAVTAPLPTDASGRILGVTMRVSPAYRQDLEENLPDQRNVALGGFVVERTETEGLAPGMYRVCIVARRLVGKTVLWNDTGKTVNVSAEPKARY